MPHDVPSISLDPGTMFAERYRVGELLGRGGMGVVYRARDLFLGEDVALKILPIPAEQHPLLSLRFRQEVKLSRRVSHPNVIRVHDIGEEAGLLYMTMEIVEGETLRERMRQQGKLDPARAVEIAKTIADALAAAHAAEIIHRDLKPSNVLLDRSGRVVLSDFGVARFMADDLHLTNGAIGTLYYMAPEQATGGRVDARSDIYSLGVVLYQMLAGERPSGSPGEVSARIERERPRVPAELSALVLRCLSLDPDGRPPTAMALSAALTLAMQDRDDAETAAWTSPRPTLEKTFVPVAPPEQKLAVLPFRYRGPKDQSYLADVLTDELVDALSRMRGLRVLGSGATQRFLDARDPLAISRELQVTAVIDGAVQAMGDRVRVSVRLIEGASGVQHWAHQHDGGLADLFAFQETVVRRVAEGLRCELHTLAHASTVPTEAIDLYLEARREMRLADEVGTRRAIELLESALAIAPGFAPAIAAHAGALGRARYVDLQLFGDTLDARTAASVARAIEQAPDIAESHIALATFEAQRSNYSVATTAALRALELAPTCAPAHELLGSLFSEAGPPERALGHLERCVEIDPQRAVCLMTLARLYALLGRREDARVTIMKVVALERPERFPPSAMLRIRDAAWHGELDALREHVSAYPTLDRFELGQMMICYARTVLGDVSVDLLGQRYGLVMAGARNARILTLGHQLFAEILAMRGLLDAALEHVSAAAHAALIDILWLDLCPPLAPLRGSPLFQEARRITRDRAGAVRTT